ncbi:MAG: hypothetical protein J6C98_10320 [Oscillospiraceae bacterium]|nr:hypothetical protein [Oscillospiraceae bacterium]
MEPVKFQGANVTYTAPGCGDLPTLAEVENGRLSVTSCWKPSEEDRAVLNSGGCICLNILGGQPPVSMWVQEVNIVE